MMFASTPRKIRVMFTPFRDGLQSVFGGKVRLDDFLPAVQRAAELGFRHLEFGGGARFQAPLFYLGENPFQCMRRIRDAVGPDVDLQILTRSVSGVTLVTQSPEGLALQARLMAKNGTTWDRNFDYMNDVDNLVRTGQPIVDAGMHHQACIALMGLPFESTAAHTAEYYVDIGRRLLESGLHIDSICMKDASGTTAPSVIYHTAVGLKKIMPRDMPLWMHTHDTASTAVSCYQAAIHGGADGVDLSCRPLASGTSQPDVRSLAHVLKGTGYSLDVDVQAVSQIGRMLDKALQEYEFDPAAITADARVLGFPMPGGAIGPNIHMMVKAGIRERYAEVLAEMRAVVEAGGAWTSVTPGSQQYWLQAFNNVLYGRWKKIDAGYGKAVLGYFGRTPLAPDPEVVRLASEQLGLPPFEGDPLQAAPNNIPAAEAALREAGLEVNDENVFLVLSSMVPGRKMESNEGMRFLLGNPKIDIPLKKKPVPEVPSEPPAVPRGPATTQVTVKEGDTLRRFLVTVEPVGSEGSGAAPPSPPASAATPVFSTFGGAVEVVDLLVSVGDVVQPGAVVAHVEAMKAKHEIRTPVGGKVTAVHARIGDEVDSQRPIVSIG
jgi:pyruvate carboxylase subunit B